MVRERIKELKREIGCECGSLSCQTKIRLIDSTRYTRFYERTTSCLNCDAHGISYEYENINHTQKNKSKECKPKKKNNMNKIKLYIGLILGTMTVVIIKNVELLGDMTFVEVMMASFIASFFIVTPPFLIMDVIVDNLKEDYNELD